MLCQGWIWLLCSYQGGNRSPHPHIANWMPQLCIVSQMTCNYKWQIQCYPWSPSLKSAIPSLTGCGSYSLTYLLYNIMQHIIILVSFFVLVWLMTPITWYWCYRHLAHGRFLTMVMSFVMGAGEVRPFSQSSTSWNTNSLETTTFYTFSESIIYFWVFLLLCKSLRILTTMLH